MDEVREFLESAKWAHAKAARLSRKVAELEAQVTRITPVYTDMPKGSGGDSTNAWIALAELKSLYAEELSWAEQREKDVFDFVESLPTPECREVLYHRYCAGLRWPDVMHAMRGSGYYYTDRQIFRIHGRALSEARAKWKENKNEASRDS